MSLSQLLQIPQVTFEPAGEIELPTSLQNNPGFPAIPSAKYYYVNPNGDKIPVINTIGNPEEQLLFLRIWYGMKSDIIFPLLTVYAKAREDQIDRTENDRPGSQIVLSMKSQIKQFADREDWIYYDRFQLLLGQMKGQSIEEFISDFYRFPLNPSADAFMVARLLES